MKFIIAYLVILLINICAYRYTYTEWKKDCKKFGEENLAVPLDERILTAFVFVTFPTLTGIIAVTLEVIAPL